MVHYSNQCHLLLLHLVDKASNWGLEDLNVIFFSPICSGTSLWKGITCHQTEVSQFMEASAVLAALSPSVILCCLLGPYSLWAAHRTQNDEMALDLPPRVCSEPSCLFFPQHKISDVPCNCVWYLRSHIWKTSSRWANCRHWDGGGEMKIRKWILYLMGESHSPQGHLLKLLAIFGAVTP